MDLKIEYLPIDELKPYENNARKHEAEDVDAIVKSIEEFGFNDPIGIWHDTIVEGHGRLLAALKLGLDKVPVVRLDHLTDEQRRAYALVHNKTAELSGWDFNLLDSELADIADIDMTEFGFKTVADKEDDGDTDTGFSYKEQYAVTVLCSGEEEQREIYERLTGEGYECKVVVV